MNYINGIALNSFQWIGQSLSSNILLFFLPFTSYNQKKMFLPLSLWTHVTTVHPTLKASTHVCIVYVSCFPYIMMALTPFWLGRDCPSRDQPMLRKGKGLSAACLSHADWPIHSLPPPPGPDTQEAIFPCLVSTRQTRDHAYSSELAYLQLIQSYYIIHL